MKSLISSIAVKKKKKRKEKEKLLNNWFSAIGTEKLKLLEEFYINKRENNYFEEIMFAGALLKYGMIFKNETFSEEKRLD